MNVVRNEKPKGKTQTKSRNELVRKDASLGIRGASALPFPIRVPYNVAPRYQYNNEDPSTSKKSSMGPPLRLPLPWSAKRKTIQNSSSTKPESSPSDNVRQRVLASDSAVADTSHDFCTPRNRPSALRYISSSSKGGTRSARSASTSAVEASVILAISEGRCTARGEIGMAAVDLRHPHLVLCQFSDSLLYTHTLTKINYFNPVEIIVPNTFCEGAQPNQLYQLIKDQYPLVNLNTVQRRHFNDAMGRQQIQTLCAPQYSAVHLQVLHKFYALTAAAAVLKYVEYIQCVVFARESLKIEYHSSGNTMIIDVGTATQLELVQPLVPSAGSTCCLLGVLGPTYTKGGIRALRAAILQPSCKKDIIEAKLDAVQDLIENESGLMSGLQDVIKKLSNIDKILFLCMESRNQAMDKMGEAQLNQTLVLKTTMDMVPKLVEALSDAESGRLRKIKMDFENPHYKEIADRIRNIIQEDAHLEKGALGSIQRCFAVRPEINGLLDVARRTYSELIDDIEKVVAQLSETYDLPLRLNQSVMKGFHIVLPITPKNRRSFDADKLPEIFIQVQNNGPNSVTMTTEDLVVMDQQAKESLNEIQKMSNFVILDLLKELRPFMCSLYQLCENVSELDILLALAQASTIGSYIRPEFNSYLEIKSCVHPLLDYNSQVMPVPNDVYATPEHNFIIITGPNMGGKSIYIKQIAIMQIMAQLGCFLPATSAVLRLCDRLFSRIGFNDSVELNASTFVFEMKEMQHILKGLTSSSLVIIDELCRGTSTEEGTSLAWAICEELLQRDAFTFFTTHFMYLTRLQELYYNVVNWHAVVSEEPTNTDTTTTRTRLVYHHKIQPGINKIEKYGLALAAKTNLPEGTVKLAMELFEVIEAGRKPPEIRTPQNNNEKILYELNAEIRQESRKHTNADEKIKEIMKKFKEEHLELLEQLRVERSNNRTSRTYTSGNFSSDPNSREESSESKRQNIRPDRVNRSDCISDRLISNSVPKDARITPIAGTSSGSQNTILNKYQNKRPIVIYCTSDEGPDQVITKTGKSNKYTSVKSSNELLNTFNIDNDDYIEETNSQNEKEANIGHRRFTDSPKTNFEGFNTQKNKSVISDENNNNSRNMEIDYEYITRQNYNDTEKPVSIYDTSDEESGSDIADALTQIVDDCSAHDETMADVSSDGMSIDEELMTETANEIREELMSDRIIHELLLAPPPGFE